MRLFLSIILIIVLSALGEYFIAWWMIAVIPFLITLFMDIQPGKAFLTGAMGIAVLWLMLALYRDVPNQHILSQKLAVLFHLPHYSLFIFVIVLLGGLIGGLAGWSGGLVRKMF